MHSIVQHKNTISSDKCSEDIRLLLLTTLFIQLFIYSRYELGKDNIIILILTFYVLIFNYGFFVDFYPCKGIGHDNIQDFDLISDSIT